MMNTKIIIYRGFNIEATNFDKLTSIEVIGNYTKNFQGALEDFGSTHRANKLTADIIEDNGFNMVVNLQDEKWLHLGINKKTFSSIDECINWTKKCIDRYIFRE